jgi:phosphoribosyl-ATP pyrophosphohydrolase
MKKFDFQELFDIIQAKINSKDKNSYTKKLAGDSNLLKRKIIEESGEVITAQTKQELIWEFADIFYFLIDRKSVV